MDGSCDILPSTSTDRGVCTPTDDGTLNGKMAIQLESPTDALNAVKLDPAVLEAQVTITQSEKSSPTTSKDTLGPRPSVDFKTVVMQQQAALLSLTPQKLDLLMDFADNLRRRRNASQKLLECSFCKNNGESMSWYSSHCLKDWRGRVKCPVLRAFKCPVCAATGDHAHTIKYCPENMLDPGNWSFAGSP